MFKKFFSNQLNISYFLNYLYIPILALFGFVLSVYLIIKFNEEYLAIFNITYLVIIISSVFILTGINDAILKLSKNNETILIQAIIKFLKNCIWYLSIIIIFLVIDFYLFKLDINLNFKIALISAPILSFNKIMYSFMLANKKLILFAFIQITRVLLLFFSTIIFINFLNVSITFGISFFFSEVILLIILIYINKIKFRKVILNNEILNNFSYKAYLNSILIEIQFKSEIFILAFFSLKSESGIFSFLIFFYEGFYEVSNVLKNILTSRYLDIIKNKNLFDKSFIKHGLANLFLNIALIGVSLIILFILSKIYIDKSFFEMIKYFLIISIGYLFFIFVHPSENIFIINGLPLIQSLYRSLSTLFNILVGIFLIANYGLMGAVINLSLSFTFAALLFLYLKNKYIVF